jgi:hypothetical protein
VGIDDLSYSVFKEPEATRDPHAAKVLRILPDGAGVKAEEFGHLLGGQGCSQLDL